MATTSLWRIKGTVADVIAYAENPNKTVKPAPGDQGQDAPELTLSSVLGYAVNQIKTESKEVAPEGETAKQFVTGINCFPNTAPQEMMDIKHHFDKEDGTVAYHGYQSFAKGEVTPEQAHEIGIRLAKQLWGDRYQVVVATHLDKESHLHNHFVINTVSFVDGKKFRRTKKDYADMRRLSDELCRECGLSVVTPKGKGQRYEQSESGSGGKQTWGRLIKADIDAAIQQSQTERQFFMLLEKQGYEFKFGSDISVRPPGKPRFFRLARNFGEEYTIHRIRKRILQHGLPERDFPEEQPKRTYRSRRFKYRKKATGLRAKYYYYCYRLGVFPKKPQRKTKLPFAVREDILELSKITRATLLLHENHISTMSELLAHKAKLVQELEKISSERKELFNRSRTVAVKTNDAALAEVKAEIAELSARARKIRSDIHVCDDTVTRSQRVESNVSDLRALDRSQTNNQIHHQKRSDDRTRR